MDQRVGWHPAAPSAAAGDLEVIAIFFKQIATQSQPPPADTATIEPSSFSLATPVGAVSSGF